MEVPVINRMTEFEPTHSFISRVISLSSVPPRFWKWGALFLALVYAFSGMAYRIKILILHYHKKSKSLLAATEPLLPNFDEDLCSDDEDDVVSTTSLSSEEDDDDGDEIGSSSDDLVQFDEDFKVKGSFGSFSESTLRKRKFKIRRRRSIGDDFSLSDLVNENGVVNLWDRSFLSDFPAVSISPAVIFSAGAGDDGVLGLGLWDFRTSHREPEVQAKWRSDRRERYTMGDVRRLETPVGSSTAALEEETWWDVDGVN